MVLQTILEGLGLGALLVLVCAVGIRKGAALQPGGAAAVLAVLMTAFIH